MEKVKYLGVPYLIDRSRQDNFNFVRKRVAKEKEKLLSQAGKEVLIKSVFQSIPTYVTSIFLLLRRYVVISLPLFVNFGGVEWRR